MASKEKQIILKYKDSEINLTIKNDFVEAINEIKRKLNFQDKDLEKYELYYLDEEEDENILDEENFEEAFNYSVWGLRPIENI